MTRRTAGCTWLLPAWTTRPTSIIDRSIPAPGAWSPVHPVNPSLNLTTASNTRYATVYANGDNVYIAARTLSKSFFTTYYLHTVRSTNGGETWFDQYKVSSYVALLSGEYGVSLAGVGDRLYMGYEVGGGLYFRTWQNGAWSNYVQLETAGAVAVNHPGRRWPGVAHVGKRGQPPDAPL